MPLKATFGVIDLNTTVKLEKEYTLLLIFHFMELTIALYW